MHRSSESIGTIAAALAKAQVDLSNPENSLVATDINPAPQGNGERVPMAATTVQAHGRTPADTHKPGNGFGRKPSPRRSGPVLPPTESAGAREKLIGELAGITSADQLTAWAY